MFRRLVAAFVVVIVVILFAVIIHGCTSSARETALKDYNNSVGSLIQQSDGTGKTVFRLLSGATSAKASSVQQSLNDAATQAQKQLSQGQHLSVPSEMKPAQQNVLLALQMRADGVANIAKLIQQVLNTTSQDPVNAIAAENARLYASDVVYTDYATHKIASALHAAGIQVGGAGGQTIQSGQFLPNIDWLRPDVVKTNLHQPASSGQSGPIAQGTHGHALDSVDVNGTALSDGATIPVSPNPTFTLNFHNSGQNTEKNVVCQVSVGNDTGTKTVAQTTSGQPATCDVQLSSPPPTGSATVTATIERVPGETTAGLANNTKTFTVTFQ